MLELSAGLKPQEGFTAGRRSRFVRGDLGREGG